MYYFLIYSRIYNHLHATKFCLLCFSVAGGGCGVVFMGSYHKLETEHLAMEIIFCRRTYNVSQ